MKLRLVVLAALCVCGVPAQAQITFVAVLSSLQEIPPNASPATGFSQVVLNAAETQITADLSWQNLVAASTAAHIHTAPVGVNGPVTFPFIGAGGMITGAVATHVFLINPAQVTSLKAGNMYVNVHSSVYPGGEIRGQLQAVPEGNSLILLLAGAAPIMLVVYRRKNLSQT